MELQIIQNKIYEIRGQKVMLDFDLAELYGTETRLLKRAVRRNMERFPDDFMFELTNEEANCLLSSRVSQFGIPQYNFSAYHSICVYGTGGSHAFKRSAFNSCY